MITQLSIYKSKMLFLKGKEFKTLNGCEEVRKWF